MSVEQELMDLMEGKKKAPEQEAEKPEVEQEQEPAVSLENPLDPNFVEDGEKDAEIDSEGGEAIDPNDAKEKDDEAVAKYKGVQESVTELLTGEELSEDFKFKAATLFEAAVKNQVEDIRQSLSEEFDKKNQELSEAFEEKTRQLEEKFEDSLTEAKQEFKVQLSEKIDAFIDTLAEQWISDNQVALEHGLKTELTESFIDGMKALFEAHYVDLPEEKFDIVSEMEKKNAELNQMLSEQVQQSAEIKAKYDSVTRDNIIAESAKGLTDLDQARFSKLTEDIIFESEETFKKKINLIKESFFHKNNIQVNEEKIVLDTKPIMEQTELNPVQEDQMAVYLKYLKSR